MRGFAKSQTRLQAAGMSKEMDLSGHDLGEYDDHDPDECYRCLLQRGRSSQNVDAANAARNLLIEVRPEDAQEREPRIKELASPILVPRRGRSVEPELEAASCQAAQSLAGTRRASE